MKTKGILDRETIVVEKIEGILDRKLNKGEKKAFLGGKPVFSKREDKEVCIQADIKTANTCVVQIMSDYHWIYKTEKISSQNIANETENFKNRLSKKDIQTLFSMATDVILVGVASQEGELIQEKDRAYRRAKKLAEFIEKSMKVSQLPNLHILNLGQYKQTSEMNSVAETIEQRKVILIGVEKNDRKLKTLLDECVKQCWDNEESTYAIKPSDYLEYELRSYERKK